jgi:mannose-6-phosphate isomerase class I
MAEQPVTGRTHPGRPRHRACRYGSQLLGGARARRRVSGRFRIVLSLLLNHVTLAEGEALYLPAGNILVCLGWLGVELMAASDTVMRGGLTMKDIDVSELLGVLDLTPVAVPYLAAETPAPRVTVFRPRVQDFVPYLADADATVAGAGLALVMSTSGALPIMRAASSIARGPAAYMTPDEVALHLSRRRNSVSGSHAFVGGSSARWSGEKTHCIRVPVRGLLFEKVG